MTLRNKIEDMKVLKVLLIIFIFIFLFMIFWMKILGATDVGIDVEKNGYCKQYGDDWENIRGENVCRNKFYYSQNIEPILFTEKDFRNYCPKHKFFLIKFSSDCWKTSGSIV